jgi:uncharacterized membrane protein YkvA (DUF1232 family)
LLPFAPPRLPRRLRYPVGAMWKQILMTLIAAGWAASPIDAIPDFVPLLGQMDDAAVVAIAAVFWWRWYKKRRTTAALAR